MGGGATHWIMPHAFTDIAHTLPCFVAWRYAFFIPGGMHLLIGIATMLISQVRTAPASPTAARLRPPPPAAHTKLLPRGSQPFGHPAYLLTAPWRPPPDSPLPQRREGRVLV